MAQNTTDDELDERMYSEPDSSEQSDHGGNNFVNVDEKDSDEEELERLVLGDKEGFRRQLFAHSFLEDLEDVSHQKELQLAAGGQSGLEGADDADLFSFDVDVGLDGDSTALDLTQQAGNGERGPDAPAWQDSDDERLTVSLATLPRLRKMRIREGEDTISGREYARRLRQQFLLLNPPSKWATESRKQRSKQRGRSSLDGSASSGDSSDADSDADSDSEIRTLPLDSFLRDVTRISAPAHGRRKRLRPEVLDIQRSRDIPDTHKAPVTSLSFHPKFPILLSSSPASLIYLHHLDASAHPTPNPLLTSVQARQVDVRRSEFRYPYGDKIFFAGRRRFFHDWDLESGIVQKTAQVLGHRPEHKSMERFKLSPCGRYMGIVASSRKGGGIINVLSTQTNQWVAAARLDGRHGIADFAWWRNGQGMTILGKDGKLGEWSAVTKRFVGLWYDEGNVGGIVVGLGGQDGPADLGGDRWVAVGSNSGIVNVYERTNLLETAGGDGGRDEIGARVIKERPQPTRCLEQLITPITVVQFAPDGQLMAFGSHSKKDALRLVHLPTCTVYRNWPTEQTPLGRITAVAFSPKSDMLVVGNDAGKIRTWEIRS